MIADLLDSVPAPRWLLDALDAHYRRRRLVVEIAAISGKTTAFLALWIARAEALSGGSVEGSLRAFRSLLLRGP